MLVFSCSFDRIALDETCLEQHYFRDEIRKKYKIVSKVMLEMSQMLV